MNQKASYNDNKQKGFSRLKILSEKHNLDVESILSVTTIGKEILLVDQMPVNKCAHKM